jgi:hypothetical protein
MRLSFQREATSFAVLSLSALGVSSVQANQVNIPAAQDASLFGGTYASSNVSLADPGMFVGTDGAINPKRGLIEFNIASAGIPSGATITAVQLQLTVGQVAGSGGGGGSGSGSNQTISLYDETQTWGQPTNVIGATSFTGDGGGKPAQNGDATWNDAFYNSNASSAVAWTTAPGGNWTSTSADIADASVPESLTNATWSSSGMVADVQNWLNNPTDNFGWLIKNQNETSATDFLAFWSAQGAANVNSNYAPVLSVTYSVPEPVAVSLIGVIAPMYLCRRQRRSPECV